MAISTNTVFLRSHRIGRRKAERDVVAWNTAHRPGIRVELRLDDDTKKETVTRSEAWEVCGQAVILLEGVAGGYLLSRVTPL